MNDRTPNLQSDLTASLPWTAPLVKELLGSEARARRAEFAMLPARPALVVPQSEIVVAPHAAALARVMERVERLAVEIAAATAEIRTLAAATESDPARSAADWLIENGADPNDWMIIWRGGFPSLTVRLWFPADRERAGERWKPRLTTRSPVAAP
jgi:hypothetical protein